MLFVVSKSVCAKDSQICLHNTFIRHVEVFCTMSPKYDIPPTTCATTANSQICTSVLNVKIRENTCKTVRIHEANSTKLAGSK